MENEQKIKRTTRRERLLLGAGGTILALWLSNAAGGGNAAANVPYESAPYNGPLTPVLPSAIVRPIHNFDNIDTKKETDLTGENRDNSPGRNLNIIILPKPLRNIDVFNQELRTAENQQDNIVKILSEHPELFNQKKIEDFEMYYPIYKAVSDKYPNVDWFLLWINHEAETGASDSRTAFDGSNYPYFGGMQRDVNVWPQSYVDSAFNGLELLNVIPTRNRTDAKEIAAAAQMLNDNIKQYLSLGKNQAVFNALKLYTGGDGLTEVRFNLWEKYKELFGPLS